MVYAKKGIIVRLTYLSISLALWCLTLGGYFFRLKKIILCYHGISNFNAKAFRQQMELIADRIAPLDTEWSNKQLKLLQPSVVITFDDAFENLLTNAIPVINELHIPVSIFVVTGYMGNKPGWLVNSNHNDENKKLMNGNQIKELADNSLISLGIHTHTHPKLTSIDNNLIADELRKSKQLLEVLTGREICSLAFPHGDFNNEVSSIAKSCGLTQLLTLEEKMIPSNQFQGEMGRFLMEPDAWSIEFRLTVDGAYSWLFYFRRVVKLLKKLVRK